MLQYQQAACIPKGGCLARDQDGPEMAFKMQGAKDKSEQKTE
jgi:hypothetical protein